jgi:hypothetical protein
MSHPLQEVVNQVSDLADFGFCGITDKEEDFRRDLESLLARQEQFEKVCEWIRSNLRPQRTFNQRRSSYALKHVAEADMEHYCTNGLLIAAMIHCGYAWRPVEATPNAAFKVSEGSVREVLRRVNERRK